MRTVFVDAGPLAHLSGKGTVAGDVSNKVEEFVRPAGSGLVVNAGKIERIAQTEELIEEYGLPTNYDTVSPDYRVVSLNGMAVIPGFVDGHTHLLWSGDRSREL